MNKYQNILNNILNIVTKETIETRKDKNNSDYSLGLYDEARFIMDKILKELQLM
ncbi:hypothetical protein [Clostridium botulinum]|uniref:hypothetical protein n=1 Tax=Clostridium botulinum TaxID=1491 RepID=UPI001C9A863A|nr:hypothetical protein [Clostridium botulinum]MBY6838746.1 hypothetical protein [Clostridium botulinum]